MMNNEYIFSHTWNFCNNSYFTFKLTEKNIIDYLTNSKKDIVELYNGDIVKFKNYDRIILGCFIYDTCKDWCFEYKGVDYKISVNGLGSSSSFCFRPYLYEFIFELINNFNDYNKNTKNIINLFSADYNRYNNIKKTYLVIKDNTIKVYEVNGYISDNDKYINSLKENDIYSVEHISFENVVNDNNYTLSIMSNEFMSTKIKVNSISIGELKSKLNI